MVFNSVHFLLFFVVVYGAYRTLGHRAQNRLLLAASYYFYGAWDPRFLALLAGSTLVTYVAGVALARSARPRQRVILWLALGFHLATLGFFKYFGFFAENLARVLDAVGFHADFVTLNVILPLGISFYTFMAIAYLVDVYRGEIEPTRDLIDFALFIAYFPHLVAGPILRASSLLPQIAAPRAIRPQDMTEGAWLLGVGLFKKIFVADNLAPFVDAVFGPGFTPTGGDVYVATFAFALQIYGDFAGYSDMARGLSQLMGIELNVNFRFPYFVTDPRAFWAHWHISLSTWLRDYLYIPLGGNRRGEWATYRNLMLTMVLGGLWHGAAWSFVLWGAYQGLLLVIHRAAVSHGFRGPASRAGRVLSWLVMMHLVGYGWLLFRARSFDQIAGMTRALLSGPGVSPMVAAELPSVIGYTVPLLLLTAFEWWRDDLLAVPKLALVPRYMVYGALFYLTWIFGQFGGAQFIYFQF
ncbi:MAG TPA: MBOAT family O-acyltransferase [Vicinamibacterales bacterium]